MYSGNNIKNKTGGGIGGIDVDHNWSDEDIKYKGIEFHNNLKIIFCLLYRVFQNNFVKILINL